jgi:hypothetical protein
MKAPVQLGFISDPAHGWLLVTEEQMDDAGIQSATFSPYSFHSQEFRCYALEEDCDAALFLRALDKQGIEYRINEESTDDDAFVRSWDRIDRPIKFG